MALFSVRRRQVTIHTGSIKMMLVGPSTYTFYYVIKHSLLTFKLSLKYSNYSVRQFSRLMMRKTFFDFSQFSLSSNKIETFSTPGEPLKKRDMYRFFLNPAPSQKCLKFVAQHRIIQYNDILVNHRLTANSCC